jgi:DNA-binding XRE family transcriptional regulator
LEDFYVNQSIVSKSEVFYEVIKQIKEFIDIYKGIDYKIVKKNIRRLRKKYNLKKRIIAEKAGISEGVYINLENISYRYKPTIEMILKLAYAFECDLTEFIKPIE